VESRQSGTISLRSGMVVLLEGRVPLLYRNEIYDCTLHSSTHANNMCGVCSRWRLCVAGPAIEPECQLKPIWWPPGIPLQALSPRQSRGHIWFCFQQEHFAGYERHSVLKRRICFSAFAVVSAMFDRLELVSFSDGRTTCGCRRSPLTMSCKHTLSKSGR
jgi:hypothetical protein